MSTPSGEYPEYHASGRLTAAADACHKTDIVVAVRPEGSNLSGLFHFSRTARARRRDMAARHSMTTTVAAVIIGAAALYLKFAVSGRQSLLFLVGVAAGLVLYHAAFGFTSAWRHFITSGRGDGLRAQMLMLAVTCAVFFPLLGRGEALGQAVRGSVSPVGVSVLAGAFMFGIGMQLGGGCASGTLYTAGGGNTRMVITLLAFIAGSVIGTAHMPWWSATPAFAPVSIVSAWGTWIALAVSLIAFAALAIVTLLVERGRPQPTAAVR